MKIDPAIIEVRNNAERRRFEIEVEGHFAFAEYMIVNNERIIFTHTEVHLELEGNGLASVLAKHAFDYARAYQFNIMPLCPYMASYMKRHPEYHDLLMPGFHLG
ncbi:MAG: N-acetyltransferase [Saprospiraceae bacterium]|nr:N-acetyltransferase [Saprospiraceae bacterium]